MFNILVVEDDANARKLMCAVLYQYGYNPIPVEDGVQGLDMLDQKHIDLIILDIMMPRMDGYEFTSTLRQTDCNIPILMVTAKESPADKRKGFLMGTDDYMTKPVDEEEMILRVGALLRRSRIASERRLSVGNTTLMYDSFSITCGDEPVELPQKEFLVLFKLLSYPNKIFTRRQLMDEIWDMDSDSDERTVDVHISRLRERFRNNHDFDIITVRGLGYKAVIKKMKSVNSRQPQCGGSVRFRIVLAVFLVALLSGVITSVFFLLGGYLQLLPWRSVSSATLVLALFFCSVPISVVLSVLIAPYAAKPFTQIGQASERIAKGDFSARVEVGGDDHSEIGNILHSFNHMAEELSNVELFRNDFINNFSHEFKTPIVSIRGFAKRLENDELTEEQRREYIHIIFDESERLSRMSENILC